MNNYLFHLSIAIFRCYVLSPSTMYILQLFHFLMFVQLFTLLDEEEPTAMVRALYDFEATEDGILSLKAGEVFEEIEEEDETGWSLGRKDGNLGWYPAQYVEIIKGKM